MLAQCALDMLYTVGIGSVEHTAGAAKEGKAVPLWRGMGRVEFAAVPIFWP